MFYQRILMPSCRCLLWHVATVYCGVSEIYGLSLSRSMSVHPLPLIVSTLYAAMKSQLHEILAIGLIWANLRSPIFEIAILKGRPHMVQCLINDFFVEKYSLCQNLIVVLCFFSKIGLRHALSWPKLGL